MTSMKTSSSDDIGKGGGLGMVCDGCGFPAHDDSPLLRCSRCRQAWYHNKECQMQDYPQHNIKCSMLKKKRYDKERYQQIKEKAIERGKDFYALHAESIKEEARKQYAANPEQKQRAVRESVRAKRAKKKEERLPPMTFSTPKWYVVGADCGTEDYEHLDQPETGIMNYHLNSGFYWFLTEVGMEYMLALQSLEEDMEGPNNRISTLLACIAWERLLELLSTNYSNALAQKDNRAGIYPVVNGRKNVDAANSYICEGVCRAVTLSREQDNEDTYRGCCDEYMEMFRWYGLHSPGFNQSAPRWEIEKFTNDDWIEFIADRTELEQVMFSCQKNQCSIEKFLFEFNLRYRSRYGNVRFGVQGLKLHI